MSPRFFSSLFALVLGISTTACLQANGETCQIDTDCESNFCCKSGTAPSSRGVCAANRASCSTVGTDAGPVIDAGDVEDASIDAEVDASDAEVDAGADEDAGSDAGSDEDAGTDDASVDAATDAGADAGDPV